jgi:endonuclease/exonuclease/phosphatase family metal-dependent hydrolase/DNA/RNA endonuclease YhcR with UshA esterase domain
MFTRTMLCVLLFSAIAVRAQDPISIAEVKKQEFNSTVTKIAGRISSAAQLSNTCYLQDNTGGIAVFNESMRTAVRIGDSVVVESATLTEFGNTTGAPGTGLAQLGGSGLKFTVIPGSRQEPSPRSTTIPNIGEGNEATLVRLRKVKMVETGRFEGNRSYNAMDNFGNDIVIRIDRACEIGTNNLEIPTGEIDIIGVVSQFRGAYQVLPRLAQDMGLPPIFVDTVSKNRTLDITTWNLEWFGSDDTLRGPFNKVLQRQRIRTVMDTIKADIYALQEVLSDEALASLSDSIKGGYKRFFASDVTSDQKLAYIYNPATVTPVSTGLAVNGGARAWGNGRFPYRMTFSYSNLADFKVVVFNIHAKATSDSTAADDYQRRKTDAETFHEYLNNFYKDSLVIVVGDFNDRLLGTTVDSTLPSCYSVFLNDSSWTATTAEMERQGLSSYVGFNRGFLDHILTRTPGGLMLHRATLESPERYLTSYSTTVSDHRPVTLRMFPPEPTSVNENDKGLASTIRVSPNPMSTTGMAEIVLEQGGHLTADIISVTGERISVANETLQPQIRLLMLPVDKLAPGAYSLVVTVNGSLTAMPIVVTR